MTTTTDRDEITDLVSRLGMALDEGRFAELRELLADDATVRTPGGEAAGPDAIVAQASRNHRPEEPIQHLITNVLIDQSGDQAQARANLVVHFGSTFTMGEIYRFALTRTPEGWRFSRIETTPVWTSGTR
jgi:ketosteroid isomerase-like protein